MNIKTLFWEKPIPLRQYDWAAWVEDGEPFSPIGHGTTEAEAIKDLKIQLDD